MKKEKGKGNRMARVGLLVDELIDGDQLGIEEIANLKSRIDTAMNFIKEENKNRENETDGAIYNEFNQ